MVRTLRGLIEERMDRADDLGFASSVFLFNNAKDVIFDQGKGAG